MDHKLIGKKGFLHKNLSNFTSRYGCKKVLLAFFIQQHTLSNSPLALMLSLFNILKSFKEIFESFTKWKIVMKKTTYFKSICSRNQPVLSNKPYGNQQIENNLVMMCKSQWYCIQILTRNQGINYMDLCITKEVLHAYFMGTRYNYCIVLT